MPASTGRSLVATFNFGDLWYARLTIPFMRRYAERVGADFIEYKTFHNAGDYPPPASWFHVEAIRIFAAQDFYENLLLLDADQLVMPSCPSLFEGLDGSMRVVRDMGQPEVGPRFIDWCLKHFGEQPQPGAYFNAGMLVIPLAVARALQPHLAGPYPQSDHMHWDDQEFLNLKVTPNVPLEWLPVEFNWLAPQFEGASLQQHIVHFVGEYKELLPSLIPLITIREPLSTRAATMSLEEISHQFETDKRTGHAYVGIYEELFHARRHDELRLLEIGVREGESLRMWREYFSKGEIVGIDIDPPEPAIAGCEVVRMHQADREAIDTRWPDQHFDIIIDDGSHRLEDQVLSLIWLWPKLKLGGLYIIEDIQQIEYAKYFDQLHGLTFDRRHIKNRDDDILIVMSKK